MEIDKPTKVMWCAIIAMDPSSLCYKACSKCETTIPDTDNPSDSCCIKCKDRRYPFKRLFRVLFSIAFDDKVRNVVCFDKAAQVIFGCSAQEFFDFAALHPNAAETARDALVCELFSITLCPPKTSNAEHMRMTEVVPIRSDFMPVIETLKEVYRVNAA